MPDLALLTLSSAALANTVTHSAHVELREEEAAGLPDGTTCRVRWIMRANGTFTQVEVLECPAGFHDRVAEVAARWTFAPPVAKVHFADVHLRPPRAPAADAASDGTAPGPLASEAATAPTPAVRWIDVAPTRRVPPVVPDGIDQPLSCALLVDFDAAGLPTAVALDTCDPALAEAAVDAAWRWRFAATDDAGQPSGGRFTVRFTVEPG